MNDLVPTEFYLGQNYPNPFKDKTIIKYCVAYKTRVRITVFNTEGEMIEKLVDEEKEAGTYKLEFPSVECPQPNDKESEHLVNGNYLYRLEAGNYIREKEMKLSK
ncbi:MAG: T9SS type A sorting domain-containing protein [Ignavibacteriaceae bacterium]